MLMSAHTDGRRMSRMSESTKIVHARLTAWARWAREHHAPGDWPELTIVGRLIKDGPGAGSAGAPPVHMPTDIAEVDAAVARLGAIDRRVIRAYYGPWEPIERLARGLSMRVREFENVLRRARWRVQIALGVHDARP